MGSRIPAGRNRCWLALLATEPRIDRLGNDDASTNFPSESEKIRTRMEDILRDIRKKKSSLTARDLQRLLYRCSAILSSDDQVRV
jgi:hypothetical protein